ncbi:uncharacterized protein LOC132952434 [Metopolophium dirhodum]|uniref:uncharacterized protein LOC132952434 n=1 Tax=Metopolophium dirhodum TaxID=44670 RepID=UPI00298FAEA5|nr:uncharacterized protein LOC132952434 [Metopolophium dirhodum]
MRTLDSYFSNDKTKKQSLAAIDHREVELVEKCVDDPAFVSNHTDTANFKEKSLVIIDHKDKVEECVADPALISVDHTNVLSDNNLGHFIETYSQISEDKKFDLLSNLWTPRKHYYFKNYVEDSKVYRFSQESLNIATAVDELFKLNFQQSSFLIDYYKDTFDINFSNLKCEMNVMKNMMNEVNFENIEKHLNEEVFPNLFKIMQVAITLPLSSATCERSFSTMRRINTYVRAYMTQGRFSNLAILNIEKDIKVDTETILNTFAKSNRRIQL